MKFEWDLNKAARNRDTHGVTFEEASSAFADPLSMTFDDPDHSIGEKRFLTFRVALTGKNLVVSHTDRNDTIRIISAREMTRQERRSYERY